MIILPEIDLWTDTLIRATTESWCYRIMPSITSADTAEIETKPQPNDIAPKRPTSHVNEEDVERGPTDESSANHDIPAVDEFQDNSQVPRYSPLRLFWFFFWRFGLFAWGGPVAQIALIKEQLVIKHKWITIARFNRAFAVYQILPGPEAAELCMFFGCLSGGRLGGIAAGVGFILPGFVLMLDASYVYLIIGFENQYVNASFRALQPLVAAMVNISLFFTVSQL